MRDLQGKHLPSLRSSERGDGSSVWMSSKITGLCATLGPDDNALRWFLGEPEMQPGDLADGLEPRGRSRGELARKLMMACEPEGTVTGSIAFIQLGRARLRGPFHAKWVQQRVVGLNHLGGWPLTAREVS